MVCKIFIRISSGIPPPLSEMDRNDLIFLQGSVTVQLRGGKLRTSPTSNLQTFTTVPHRIKAFVTEIQNHPLKKSSEIMVTSPILIIRAASLWSTLIGALASAHAMEGEIDKFL